MKVGNTPGAACYDTSAPFGVGGAGRTTKVRFVDSMFNVCTGRRVGTRCTCLFGVGGKALDMKMGLKIVGVVYCNSDIGVIRDSCRAPGSPTVPLKARSNIKFSLKAKIFCGRPS